MMNHVHPLMKQRTSWYDPKPLSKRAVWVFDLVLWYGFSNRVNRRLNPWEGVGESGSVQRLSASIRSHM